MSKRRKKSRKHKVTRMDPTQTQPAPANIPAADLQPQTYQPGQQVVAKRPNVGSNWEASIIEADPVVGSGRMIVAFPDGTRYYADTVEISGPVAAAAPAPQESLNSEYATLLQLIVEIDRKCNQLLDMPLDVLIARANRIAIRQELSGNGKMAAYDGMHQFVPDSDTLSTWLAEYLKVVQERERAAGVSAE